MVNLPKPIYGKLSVSVLHGLLFPCSHGNERFQSSHVVVAVIVIVVRLGGRWTERHGSPLGRLTLWMIA